ncbi:MAG TPA: peptide deformylase [Aquella sp.]|nr:peptide deformylase [Aquella sp.]
MIKEVLTTGNELLGQVSEEVTLDELNTPQLKSLIEDMIDTMKFKNGVGIAAVQIGVPKRIAIIGYDSSNPRYKDIGSFPITVIINPSFEAVGDEVFELNEGCLSVPGIRGDVIRAKKLRYKYQDMTGTIITGETDSFFARVLQHEIDHMNGILFPMRIEDIK